MTWGEIKLLTLQKMFSAPGGRIENDDVTIDYLKAMPGAANEGLRLLSTAGRFLKKPLRISQDGTGTGTSRYDLGALGESFYTIDEHQVFYIDAAGTAARTSEYVLEAERVLLLPGCASGEWLVYYNAYPGEITAGTPDEYVLDVMPEVAALLPLYMASQLYKEDDAGLATQYRNEFEVGRDELKNNTATIHYGRETWENTTNWW